MKDEPVKIDWSVEGKPDLLLGSGADRWEQALAWAAGLLGAGLILGFALRGEPAWAWWQFLLAGLLAFDVIGGVTANALNSCKRFCHSPASPGDSREARLAKNHLLFTALHVHPLLAAALFGGALWPYGLVWYAALLLGALLLLRLPLYLRRPAAFLLISLALLGNQYLITAPAGFEWLVPALYLKILYGHLVREEPYRA